MAGSRNETTLRPRQGGRRWAQLAAAPFTYPEVGATASTMPSGYRHFGVEPRLGAPLSRHLQGKTTAGYLNA